MVKGELLGDIEYTRPGIGLTRGSDGLITKLSIELEGLVDSPWHASIRPVSQVHKTVIG
jgi:hypothetical protein